ncbi:hypothetical protein LT493_43885 [Streptomyces tricolor]|nr:hypothetical protein [Streptomyces tricolor]
MGLSTRPPRRLGQVLVGMAVPEDARVRTMAAAGAVRNCGYARRARCWAASRLLVDHGPGYAAVIWPTPPRGAGRHRRAAAAAAGVSGRRLPAAPDAVPTSSGDRPYVVPRC